MVSIELGKEIEKDVFRLITSMGQRKNSEYPRGIEPQSSDALPRSHRDFTMNEIYCVVHMTRVLNIAKISNVDSVMFVNRIRDMVSFELVKLSCESLQCFWRNKNTIS